MNNQTRILLISLTFTASWSAASLSAQLCYTYMTYGDGLVPWLSMPLTAAFLGAPFIITNLIKKGI